MHQADRESRAAEPERPVEAAAPRMATGYHPGLDGLRAVAVLAVMAFHIGWLPGGAVGVDIFFTLSGYLITGLLYTEYRATGRMALKGFFVRRGTRLLPALLLISIVWYVIAVVLSPANTAKVTRTVFAVITYTTNWLMIAGQPLEIFFGHTWSLAIEEQFYILWPAVLWIVLARTRTDRGALWALAGLTALATVWRAAAFVLGTAPEVLYYRSDIRAEALLVGAALSVLLHTGLVPVIRRGLLVLAPAGVVILGVVMAAVSPWGPVWYTGLGLAVSLSVAAILTCVVLTPSSRLARLLSRPRLVLIGQISYGLYLWHNPIFISCRIWLPDATFPFHVSHGIIGTALTFACAGASYRWLERPCREAGRRITSASRARSRPATRAEASGVGS
jgi:peptidoglycan/LPS O-acetylase OafA/YrhL